MAYENGKRINRYYNMQKGKEKHERKCGKQYGFWLFSEDYPWRKYYISKDRNICKKMTNKAIRQKYKNDSFGDNRSGYRKAFDYWRTIW